MPSVRLEVPITGTQQCSVEGDTLEEIADNILKGEEPTCYWGSVNVDAVNATKREILLVLQDMVQSGDLTL